MGVWVFTMKNMMGMMLGLWFILQEGLEGQEA